ncbi:zf-RanBP domain containing protein [Asbolus verrucosus]|uniref:Nuclear pore complex protein Nup153 n=1 Tax=Asbolus verrucosus TaxID=1661398 RepID=A0A482VRL4_ASBVE|nr:zf-RanBP domain containing protein [Asbolus verrucosus]
MIRNKNDLNKCQACETLKASPKSTSTQKVVTFGDKFKPPPETWECPTCMIRNKNELTKCSACETVKPGQKAPSNSSGVTFTFGIAPLGWGCKKCLIKNTSDAKTCAACGTLNDKELERRGFGEAFKMKEGEWECSSCLVKNKREVDTCVCCGVSKPGSTSEKLSEINKEEEKKPVISFNFGIDKSSPVQFKFGIPTTTKNEEVKENNSVTVSAPTPAPTFTFGDVAKTATVTSSSFSFGINTQEKVATVTSITSASESITSTIVSSNPLLKPSEKLPEKAVPAPVGFMFGLDNSSSQKPESRKQISEENIVTSTSKTEAPVVFSSSFEPVKPALPIATFQFKPAAINGDINKPKDLFGSKPAESGNLFSNPALTPTFKFNVKPPEDSTVTTTVAAQPQASAAGIFKFGTENSQSVVPIKKTFGETTENNVSNGFSSIAKAPAFASPQTFGTVENKSFTFGISDSTPKNTRFSFGQPEKTATPNPVFNFGSGASSTPSAGFNFSSTNTGFNFGSAGKIESLPFNPTPTNVFGSTTTEAAKNGSFNFGTNSNNNNQKAIFSFGASQTNTPSFGAQNPSGFNFGAPVVSLFLRYYTLFGRRK